MSGSFSFIQTAPGCETAFWIEQPVNPFERTNALQWVTEITELRKRIHDA